MPILNYTTKIDAGKTIAEIQHILGKLKVGGIMITYHEGHPNTLMFALGEQKYRLPCRAEMVYAILKRDPNVPPRLTTTEQARRVAWRIVKDWVEAQAAIIESGMVAVDEVFLPYRLARTGETLYEVISRGDRLLPDLTNED